MNEDFFSRRRDIRDERPLHVKYLLESSLFTAQCWYDRCDKAFIEAMREAYPEYEEPEFRRRAYCLRETGDD